MKSYNYGTHYECNTTLFQLCGTQNREMLQLIPK